MVLAVLTSKHHFSCKANFTGF